MRFGLGFGIIQSFGFDRNFDPKSIRKPKYLLTYLIIYWLKKFNFMGEGEIEREKESESERECEREKVIEKERNWKTWTAPTCTYIKFKYSVIVTFLFKVYAVLREQWICPERPNRQSFCFYITKDSFWYLEVVSLFGFLLHCSVCYYFITLFVF